MLNKWWSGRRVGLKAMPVKEGMWILQGFLLVEYKAWIPMICNTVVNLSYILLYW